MNSERPIVVTGGTGMLGSGFVETASKNYHIESPDSKTLDLLDREKTVEYLRWAKPAVVINFAAMTDVNAAEKERDDKNGKVYKLNTLAPHELQRLSEELNFYYIQISTDMTRKDHDGQHAPFDENSRPHLDRGGMGWYSWTKSMGEYGVDITKNAVVLIIYPIRPGYEGRKKHYLKSPIDAFGGGKTLTYFDDQTMNVTLDKDLFRVLEILSRERRPGVFPVATIDVTTPYKIVSKTIEEVFGQRDVVQRMSLEQEIRDKKIPSYRYALRGGLAVLGTQKKLGVKFVSTDDVVAEVARAEKRRS